jgi:hypothetical protein
MRAAKNKELGRCEQSEPNRNAQIIWYSTVTAIMGRPVPKNTITNIPIRLRICIAAVAPKRIVEPPMLLALQVNLWR